MASVLATPATPAPVQDATPTPARSSANRRRRAGTPLPCNAVWNRTPWKWLFSLRVGLVLLVMLTVASIVGTLIDPLERAQATIYYSWWYKLLLLSLAVNMACATVQTIVQKVLPSRALRLQTSSTFYEAARPNAECSYAGGADSIAAEFRRQGCEVLVDGDVGVARRGWIGRLGGPVSHAGLVIVLLAGFASSWVAREGFVRIPEGESATTMKLRGGSGEQVPLGFTLAVDDFSTGYFPRTRIPSHFESHVTASSTEGVLYSGAVEVNNSPQIGGWRLHQTSYEELRGSPRRAVELVPPGSDNAITVEASPGQTVPIRDLAGLAFSLGNGGAWTITKGSEEVASGTLATDHGSNLSLRAERFEPDFVLGADRKITSRSQEPNNPALQVTLLSDGAPAARQWLFGREDMKQFSHSSNDHFRLELVETGGTGEKPSFVVSVLDGHSGLLLGTVSLGLGEEVSVGAPESSDEAPAADAGGWKVAAGEPVAAYATVLTLTRNPAIPVIYAGCGLMMIGLVLGFFVRRREVWFMVDRPAGKLRVVAHYRHPSDEFDASTASVLARFGRPSPTPQSIGASA